MKKRAIVCVTNDLATDQRVRKTCVTLTKLGYETVAYGRILPDSLPADFDWQVRRIKHYFNHSALFYAEYNIRLFLFLLFSKIDLIFSNDLDTLPACFLVSKIRRKRIIFDSHELFTEVPELVNRPGVQAVWEHLERWIIPRLKEVITVNDSIAKILSEKYHIEVLSVRNIPNTPTGISHLSPKKNNFPKVIIYQGAINRGRGLEAVFRAMPMVQNARVDVYGDGDILSELKALVTALKIEDKVRFLGRISPDKLKKITPNADIGLCLLENLGKNYFLSLPNRIFDYLHAKVPVLTNDYPEIAKIVKKHKTGTTVESLETENLVRTINEMLTHPQDTAHFEALAKQFCWENEEKKLIKLITQE